MARSSHPAPHLIPGAHVVMICPKRGAVPPELPPGSDVRADPLLHCPVCGSALVAAWVYKDGELI